MTRKIFYTVSPFFLMMAACVAGDNFHGTILYCIVCAAVGASNVLGFHEGKAKYISL